MTQPAPKPMTVVFQGELGANSHIAVTQAFPRANAEPLPTFEDCFQAVESGAAMYAMIPIENSVAGRVADIHTLLPASGVHFIGEHFLPVRHQLVAVPGASLDTIKDVHSHVQALGQCRLTLRKLSLNPMVAADTAGSARMVADRADPTVAAIASELAADIYGLKILARDVEDEAHNTTRFVVIAANPMDAPIGVQAMTSFIFRVRNVPAALYKALGGFATNSVNMMKLESYQLGGQFFASMFYADVEGHREDPNVKRALEELDFFSAYVRVLGSYPASGFRESIQEPAANAELRPSPHA